jgi:hypothetical protein
MAYITKSLIQLTLNKYIEKGLPKMQAIAATANELGIGPISVERYLYVHRVIDFDTKGHTCDPKWFESVQTIYTHAKELYDRVRYIKRLVNALDDTALPIDHRKIESLHMLVDHLTREAKSVIPASACTTCDSDPHCRACSGFGWLAKND